MAAKILKVRASAAARALFADRETPVALLNDEDERHPNGHVMIYSDGKTVDVGDTPRVQELISAGTLELADEKPKQVSGGN